MNVIELSEAVAEEARITKTEANEVVRAVFGKLADALAEGEEVKIAGFGTFKVKERAARKGLNPSTGEPIEIAATKVVGFKPAKHLKDSVK